MFPQAYSPISGLSELDRVRQENELLQKKLSKAISKRNYYAKLYYSCMLERDKAMAEREGALKELQRVLIQVKGERVLYCIYFCQDSYFKSKQN